MILSIQKLKREIRLLIFTILFITVFNVIMFFEFSKHSKTNTDLAIAQAELLYAQHLYLKKFLSSIRPETSESTVKKSGITHRYGQ
jgi:hypothetical protein